jgi:hypothetical protein
MTGRSVMGPLVPAVGRPIGRTSVRPADRLRSTRAAPAGVRRW